MFISVRALFLFITLLMMVAGFYWYQYYSAKAHISKNIFFPEAHCKLDQGTCSTQLPSGEEVTLSLTATPLPALIPLNIQVQIQNLKVIKASVELKGTEMYMGDNHPTLSIQADGSVIGNTLLPACRHPKMQWVALVTLSTPDSEFIAPFSFTVEKTPH